MDDYVEPRGMFCGACILLYYLDSPEQDSVVLEFFRRHTPLMTTFFAKPFSVRDFAWFYNRTWKSEWAAQLEPYRGSAEGLVPPPNVFATEPDSGTVWRVTAALELPGQ